MAAQTKCFGEADLVCRVVFVLVENKGVGNAIVFTTSICI